MNDTPRRALVTGGSGALGAAICRALAAGGFDLTCHAGSRLQAAEDTAEAINAGGGRARAVAFDLADDQAVAVAMQSLLQAGPFHVVVHNAGAHRDAPLAGMDAAAWRQVIEVNLNAFYRVVQPAMLPMCRLRWGRVIAISSVAARLGNRGQTNYAAAKAGLHGAIFSLSREVAKRGITCNVVAPGIIESDMTREVFDADSVRRLVPAGHAGRPQDVAALIAFLCSDAAGYISGQVIGVDGGMTAG